MPGEVPYAAAGGKRGVETSDRRYLAVDLEVGGEEVFDEQGPRLG